MSFYALLVEGTTFQRLDTRVDQADAFANMRDLQMKYRNHNALLAGRVRRCVFSSFLGASAGFVYSIAPPSLQTATLLLQQSVFVSQYTRKLKFVLRANKTNHADANDVLVYFTCRPLKRDGSIQSSPEFSASMTVSATSETKYTATLQIPESLNIVDGFGEYLVSMYATGNMYTTDSRGPYDLTDIGPDWAEDEVNGFATPATNHAIYFTTDADIEPRLIVRTVGSFVTGHGKSSALRVYVDKPFNKLPDVNSDQWALRLVAGISISTLSIYEMLVTNLNAVTLAGPI